MPVLSAGVITKSGKTLLARQFVEISKARIEGLLTAFPKMVSADSQHTFIETDQVRYLYQPIDNLYVVIITNKSSNILEDLETLQLVSKIVPEYAMSNVHEQHLNAYDAPPQISLENEIVKNAFEIIFALDETISMGYKERVNLQQIRHFTSMISHDEERWKDQERTKILLAKKEMDRKRKEIESRRMEDREVYQQGRFRGLDQVPSPVSTSPAVTPVHASVSKSASSSSASSMKGMRLGSKNQNNNASKVLEEMNVREIEVASPDITSPESARVVESAHKFEVSIVEKIIVNADNDGGLLGMEVKGELRVTANHADYQNAHILVSQGQISDLQIITHPSMDKNLFSSKSILAKKSGSSFPLFNMSQVLKWRITSKSEDMIPLMVTLWPEDRGNTTVVPIEFSKKSNYDLHDVVISVPVNDKPAVGGGTGSTNFNAKNSTLEWHIPLIDKSSANGSIEFKVPKIASKSFFPVSISFRAEETYFPIQVVQVTGEDESQSLEFHSSTVLQTEQYFVEL